MGGLWPSRDNTQCSVRLGFSLVLFRSRASQEESRPCSAPCPAHTQLLCESPDLKLHPRSASRDSGHRCASAGHPGAGLVPALGGRVSALTSPKWLRSFSCSVSLGWASSGQRTPMETQPPSQVPCSVSAGRAPLASVTEGLLGFGDPTVHFHPGQGGPP